MRTCLAVIVVILLVSALPALAQKPDPLYRIEKEQIQKGTASEDRVSVIRRLDRNGRPTLYVTLQFKITRADGQQVHDVLPGEIVVLEDNRRVTELEIHSPTAAEPLTTILAIDISGSMADHGKMGEAKKAARLFLDRLEPKAECGLILFDHVLRTRERPVRERQRMLSSIAAARPGGGTAYLDATVEAIAMLRNVKGRRAILLLTDGVDLNSQQSMEHVIQQARAAEVPVYTIGVGEPGQNIPVTTVLVLDCSGSMDEPADDTDEISKMVALHQAAGRFVDIMRPGARTTLLPFSEKPEIPKPFSSDKAALKRAIQKLEARGQTALFDATGEAIDTLVAARPEGKRAVIVLTDGKDNRSRRYRVAQVIAEAKNAEIPLHMLGLGRAGELDERVMRRMGQETGGTYHHARNKQMLYEIFEDLSIQLHDDGIDEATLKKLAADTGGKYYPAHDISQLQLIYEGLAQELQTTYTVTFPSLRQDYDGTSRDIKISVWRQGVQVSDVLKGGYNVHGVIVPEMDHRVYLGLLAVLGGLLGVPAGMKWLSRRPTARTED